MKKMSKFGCKVCGQTPCNCTSVDEGTVDDHIKKVVNIYSKHRNLEDKASYTRDKVARAKHKEGAKRASALLAKMRSKQAAANADKPKPTEVHHDYSAAIAQDYKDQEKRRGVGHVRDHVEVDPYAEVLAELKDTTLQSYTRLSAGDAAHRQNITNWSGKKDPKIAKRNAGQALANKLMKGPTKLKEDIANEAQSAAVKLQKAFQREMERSEAERKRGEELMKKPTAPAPKKEEKEMKTFKQIMEASGKNVHPDALHVSPVKVDGKTKYKVHAVGKNHADGIKVGEHLSDSELDDFSDMGGKVKHIKQ